MLPSVDEMNKVVDDDWNERGWCDVCRVWSEPLVVIVQTFTFNKMKLGLCIHSPNFILLKVKVWTMTTNGSLQTRHTSHHPLSFQSSSTTLFISSTLGNIFGFHILIVPEN